MHKTKSCVKNKYRYISNRKKLSRKKRYSVHELCEEEIKQETSTEGNNNNLKWFIFKHVSALYRKHHHQCKCTKINFKMV